MDTSESNDSKVKQMVFAHVGGCWVSGHVQHEIGSVLTIRLVTGTVIKRANSEVLTESPRLNDRSLWPL
jgi:hypothetical protein